MLRHVTSPLTNQYWIHCYLCIRTYYPEHRIIIIDDASDYEHITLLETTNCEVVQSKYPGRGEFLPYYYYIFNPDWFQQAVILHDSVFINSYIDFEIDVEKNYQCLWSFSVHRWDNVELEKKMLAKFNNEALNKLYRSKKWLGCFGAMTVITHAFLLKVHQQCDFNILCPLILTRTDRHSFERVLACMLLHSYNCLKGVKENILKKVKKPNAGKFGDILTYCPWGIQFDDLNQEHFLLPIIKVWTGR